MDTQSVDVVTFSDLSRNPSRVAERAARLGRLRVTHRDASDFYLTAADREEQREENLATAARMFSALMKTDDGARAMLLAISDVFPWTRHLTEQELHEFGFELIDALSDVTQLNLDDNAHEVIIGWQATARIKADKCGYAAALRPTEGDLGPVEVMV